MSGLEDLNSYLQNCQAPVDLERICDVIKKANITRASIEQYCIFNETTYHRNLVSSSSWYQLLVMCWRAGQKSAIHDHCGSGCAFKIIEGVSSEIIFEKTQADFVKPIETRTYAPGQICSARETDIHQICNAQSDGEDLITLHLYSPPLKMNTYEVDPQFAAPDMVVSGVSRHSSQSY